MILVTVCILICVCCDKGCTSPVELRVVDTTVDLSQGGTVSVLVLL